VENSLTRGSSGLIPRGVPDARTGWDLRPARSEALAVRDLRRVKAVCHRGRASHQRARINASALRRSVEMVDTARPSSRELIVEIRHVIGRRLQSYDEGI
jgi:hypothetical protein